MNEKKPIRRHSRLRRVVMQIKYYSAKSLRSPIWLLFFGFTVFTVILTLFGCLGFFYLLLCLLMGEFASWSEALKDLARLALILACVLFGDYILYRLYDAYYALPQGHLLNPLPPAPNEILPEAEVLVRASSVSDAAQKETLLRPAAANADAEPQTLLRAANGSATE